MCLCHAVFMKLTNATESDFSAKAVGMSILTVLYMRKENSICIFRTACKQWAQYNKNSDYENTTFIPWWYVQKEDLYLSGREEGEIEAEWELSWSYSTFLIEGIRHCGSCPHLIPVMTTSVIYSICVYKGLMYRESIEMGSRQYIKWKWLQDHTRKNAQQEKTVFLHLCWKLNKTNQDNTHLL